VVVCIATDTEPEKFPPLGVIVGVATVNASVTLSVKAVVLVMPPPVEVTVIEKLPAGVDPLVTMFNTVEHDGLQAVEEKDPVAPAGNPDTLKETGWLLPETNAAPIELVTEDPATTDLFPELEREKLKGWLTVNGALASVLALDPLLNALAFIVALLVRVMVPLYRVDAWVGVEPLVV
jgi:hypothetical protein